MSKKVTWRQVKAMLANCTDEQLDEPVRVWGDERGFEPNTIEPLDEPFFLDDEGWNPVSTYEYDTYDEELSEFEQIPAGTPVLYIDMP